MQTELLAQLIEEVSVMTSEHRRRKPVKVPRPDYVRRQGRPHSSSRPGEGGRGMAAAVDTLRATRRAVHAS